MLLRSFLQYNGKWTKRALTAIAVVLFFSLFGYWKFQEPLTNHEVSLAMGGDGLAWIGIIYTVDQEVRENGFRALWGDTFWSQKLGFDLIAPYPLNAYWKLKFCILSRLLSVEKVYELIAIVAFALIGTFGFLLLREMGASMLFSLIGALLLTHMDHFFSRLDGHMVGVGSYYLPILLTWGAIRAGKQPTMWRLAVLSFLNALNFMVFEYYGYFGIFFSSTLFLCYFLKYFKKDWPPRTTLALRFVLSGIIFFASMCLFYPSLIFHRVYCSLFSCQDSFLVVHNEGHSFGEFLFYSVRNPFAIFSSSLPWLQTIGENLFKNNLGEFTFRIGLVLPLFTMGSMFFLGFRSLIGKAHDTFDPLLKCLVWFPPMILMVLFALNPKDFASLVPLTYKIAPMFRVAARAFLYVDIALIVLFVYLSDRFARSAMVTLRDSHPLWKRLVNGAVFLLVLAVTAVGIEDVTGGRLLKKANAYKLPDTSIYQCLMGKEEGLLLELPAFSPITDDTGNSYIYFYNRTKHGFPIANIWYPLPSNVEFREQLHRLSEQLNSLSSQTIIDLKKTGVRYIVVNKKTMSDTPLRESHHVKLIADSPAKSIFQMRVDETFASENFLEYFVYSAPTIVFKSGFNKEERKDGTYWRWATRARCEIVLKNHSSQSINVKFSSGFCAFVGSLLELESPFFSEHLRMNEARIQYSKNMELKPKSEVSIIIKSDAPPYLHSKPDLVFYIFNYKLEPSH